MENIISRGSTFGDFVTILTERSMQDVTVERSRVNFSTNAITRKIVQCYCVHRVVYTLYSFSTNVTPAYITRITRGESALYSSNWATLEQQVHTPLSPLLNVMYQVPYLLCKSLSGQSKYALPRTKEKRVVGNLCISLDKPNILWFQGWFITILYAKQETAVLFA
jgi:hypothetical protein